MKDRVRSGGFGRTFADSFGKTAFWTNVGTIRFAILPSSYVQRYTKDVIFELRRIDEEYGGSGQGH
jgi:hypothetical protein